jgi:hypothetical protein
MERYNREFNDLFDSPKPGLFVFCERIKDEAMRWESRHQDALMGRYTHRQKRKDVAWPEIPEDFDEWAPKKRENLGRKGDFCLFGCVDITCGIFRCLNWGEG